nr:MAG TPA: hypothetical protein [Caudoviricetes sp.]
MTQFLNDDNDIVFEIDLITPSHKVEGICEGVQNHIVAIC